ncbi:diacylglycerol/lipid kinase family protein [Acetobacter syzygii]|uniref:diacylglycerol/lipid kinase family protein n=1 Tax=Acetobacter syzygii TaxID=146476 RepID=UPI0039E79353
MKKVLLIVNPNSGNYCQTKVLKFIENLYLLGVNVDVKKTIYAGHVKTLARTASLSNMYSHIIACGGDGTISEVAENIVGTKIILGILPIGTANVLAHDLKIPFDTQKNAQRIFSGRYSITWPGYVKNNNKKYFFIQMSGIGIDAEIIKNNNKNLKKIIGKLSYVFTGFLSLLRYDMKFFTIDINGEKYKSTFAIISKGELYAGKYKLFTSQNYNKKSFSVLIFKSKSKFVLLYSILSIFLFKNRNLKSLRYIESSSLKVISEKKVPIQCDGDEKCYTPVCIDVSDYPLKICC